MFAGMPTRKNKIVVMFTDGKIFQVIYLEVKAQAKKEKHSFLRMVLEHRRRCSCTIVNEQGQAIGHQKMVLEKWYLLD